MKAAAGDYDVVVVGGGIQGACVALEAVLRGLRTLLVEKGDFGEATSWNSLRILHGGLRYLQSLDLRRFRESVSERRWFCHTFPELVRPQECLMPLYGEGLKRPAVFAGALFVNDLLSWDRNVGLESARRIERGRILGVAETIARFPLVDRHSLRGAGLWYDARMVSSQRVLIEILHWACGLGAKALNYAEAAGLVTHRGAVCGVEARDALDGRTYTFKTRLVCNCAGPWSADLAARFNASSKQLFRPSLAFNVLLDREPPSPAAVAVAPRRQNAPAQPVYFLYPAFGRLLAGTVHAPWIGTVERPQPTQDQILRFLTDLNLAIPGLDVRLEHVLRVFSGLLPVTAKGTANLAVRPLIRDHANVGGPDGLISISGVKFTTARLVAEKTMAVMAKHLGPLPVRHDIVRPAVANDVDLDEPWQWTLDVNARTRLRRLVEEESVMTVDDLLFRRTHWAIVERNVNALRHRVSEALKWGESSRTNSRGV
jgi:glycerol-3-phosphate dehydrogenase